MIDNVFERVVNHISLSVELTLHISCGRQFIINHIFLLLSCVNFAFKYCDMMSEISEFDKSVFFSAQKIEKDILYKLINFN